MRLFTSTMSFLLLAAPSFSLAQAEPPYPPYRAPGDFYFQRHASTLEEGIQRGYGDVVRSYGMANLLNSEAAKNYEQARRDYIENRLKATQAYFEARS